MNFLFICVEWLVAWWRIFISTGRVWPESCPYIFSTLHFTLDKVSNRIFNSNIPNSNVKSNPNISSVLPGLGMKGFIQSSWVGGTSLSLCHAVMPATTYIIALTPLNIWAYDKYLACECARTEAHLKRCRCFTYRYKAYTLGTHYFLTLTLLFQLIGPLC